MSLLPHTATLLLAACATSAGAPPGDTGRDGAALSHGLGIVPPGSTRPNHNPLYDRGPDVYVLEDSGRYAPAVWARNIVDGDGPVVNGRATDSELQTVKFRIIVGNPTLFSSQPLLGDDGLLTFNTAADRCGVSLNTVELFDSGTPTCIGDSTVCPCFPVDCRLSVQSQFFIEVVCVNDPPSFRITGDVSTQQDSGKMTVFQWAFDVSKGADNEAGQSLVWVVTNDNTALFSTQPHVLWSNANPTVGDLVYRPADGKCGSALATVRLRDDNGTLNSGGNESPLQTFTITVVCVNKPPSFQCGGDVRAVEDQGVVTVRSWASSITTGDMRVGQTLQFELYYVDVAQASLFHSEPRLDTGTGDLTFQTKPDVNTFTQPVELYVMLRDSDGGTSCDLQSGTMACCKLRISVEPVNDPPSFTCGGDIVVCEDLHGLPVSPTPPIYTDGNLWATQISVGAFNEGVGQGMEGQLPAFRLQADVPQLFAQGPSIDSSGTLTFELKPDANGKTGVKVFMSDTGSNSPPNSNEAASCEFTITVLAVADAPSFSFANGKTMTLVTEDAPPADNIFLNWVTDVSKGPLNEFEDVLSFVVTSNNPGLFKVPPAVSLDSASAGRLSFELAPHACGSAELSVELRDTGDLSTCSNKGKNSVTLSHTLKVDCANDAPVFNFSCEVPGASPLPGGVEQGCKITVCEDSVAYSATNFIRSSHGGPQGFFDEASQTVSFSIATSNDRLFEALPAITAHGTLTFKTKPDATGSATVSVTAIDSGVPPKTSLKAFSIEVTPANDPPDFTLRGDITVEECVSTYSPQCEVSSVLPSSCSRVFNNWVTEVRPSLRIDTGEDLQTVSLEVIVDQAVSRELFEVPPSIDPATGSLSFTTRVGVRTTQDISLVVLATDSESGNTACGGRGTSSKLLTLRITEVNWPPCVVCGGDITVLEDSGKTIILGHARNITAGPALERDQALAFTLTPSVPALFLEAPAIDVSSGNLYFTPKADSCGVTEVTARLDDGSASNSNVQCSFQITVVGVNDAPSFRHGSRIAVAEDEGFYCTQWVHEFTAGPFEDRPNGACAQQVTSFSVSIVEDVNAIFLDPPAIDATTGNICFKSKTDICGVATLQVQLRDDGGSANGGIDVSPVATTEIEVTCINDPPSFTPGEQVIVCEDSGPFVHLGWCSRQTAGPAANEASQQLLTFNVANDNKNLFHVEPHVDAGCNLYFTPMQDASGTATLTIDLCDNGPTTTPHVNCANRVTRRITVLPVNDAPSFLHAGDISVVEDTPARTYPKWARQITKGGSPLSALGSEEEQGLAFVLSMTREDERLFSRLPSVDVSGDLTFGLAPDVNGQAEVTVCLKDTGGTGPQPSVAGPVVCSGGVDAFCSKFSIVVAACNDKPRFSGGLSVEVPEDNGVTTVASWIRDLTTGPPDESGQVLVSIVVSVPEDRRRLFTQLPFIAQNGDLTFTPAPDVFGSVTVSVTLRDDGGTAGEGCLDIKTHTFAITIRPVNDPPQFLPGDEVVSVSEDSGRYSAQWATGITAGPGEDTQKPIFIVDVQNPRLFDEQPTLSPAGVLAFSPAANAFGESLVTVRLYDGGGDNSYSPPQSIRVVVRPVNDPPSFTRGKDIAVTEGQRAFCERGWASKISGGPGESDQSVTFSATPTCCAGYFAVLPHVDGKTGDLCFTLAASASGNVPVDITAQDDGVNTDQGVGISLPQSFTISITPVNSAPAFNPPAAIEVLEDTPLRTFAGHVTGITAGAGEDGRQTLRFVATPRDPQMFLGGVSADPTSGDISFALASNMFGTTTVDLTLSDDGGTALGGVDRFSHPLTIRVLPVNDAPTFTAGVDVTDVFEDAPRVTIPSWATQMVAGPSNEQGQTLSFEVSVDTPGIFLTLPRVAVPSGELSFTPYPDASGVSLVRIHLRDNGGVANGGSDLSPAHALRIRVREVNDPPSYIPGPPTVRVAKNSGPYEQQWARGVVPGPPDEAAIQTINFTASTKAPDLFSVLPSLGQDGVLRFEPKQGAEGRSSVIILITDSGGASGNPSEVVVVVSSDSPSVIRVISAEDYNLFSTARFTNTVAGALEIPESRVMVVGIQPGSVVIDFFFAERASDNEPTSKQLADSFLLKVRDFGGDPAKLKEKLSILETYPLTTSDATAIPSVVNPVGGSGGSGLKDAQIAAIVICVLLVVGGLAGGAFFLWRRHKRRQSGLRHHQDAACDEIEQHGSVATAAASGGTSTEGSSLPLAPLEADGVPLGSHAAASGGVYRAGGSSGGGESAQYKYSAASPDDDYAADVPQQHRHVTYAAPQDYPAPEADRWSQPSGSDGDIIIYESVGSGGPRRGGGGGNSLRLTRDALEGGGNPIQRVFDGVPGGGVSRLSRSRSGVATIVVDGSPARGRGQGSDGAEGGHLGTPVNETPRLTSWAAVPYGEGSDAAQGEGAARRREQRASRTNKLPRGGGGGGAPTGRRGPGVVEPGERIRASVQQPFQPEVGVAVKSGWAGGSGGGGGGAGWAPVGSQSFRGKGPGMPAARLAEASLG